MSDEQPKTLAEQQADLERQLRDLEANKGTFVSAQYPITPEARAQQIDRLKASIRAIKEARNTDAAAPKVGKGGQYKKDAK